MYVCVCVCLPSWACSLVVVPMFENFKASDFGRIVVDTEMSVLVTTTDKVHLPPPLFLDFPFSLCLIYVLLFHFFLLFFLLLPLDGLVVDRTAQVSLLENSGVR